MRKGMRVFALVLATMLLVGGVIGGTIAWLSTKTTPVVNTFTYGDINIALDETPGPLDDGDNNPYTNQYPMIPGSDIAKDPEVTVKSGSEACWLFVKLDKSANFDSFLTVELAEGWTALEGVEGVYYREVEKTDADLTYSVLKDDKVSVKAEVTKQMFNELTPNTYPTLTITAYAVQKENIPTAAQAWTYAVGA